MTSFRPGETLWLNQLRPRGRVTPGTQHRTPSPIRIEVSNNPFHTGCRNYDICYIDFMLPAYCHHLFCLICNLLLTVICKRQFITRASLSCSQLFFSEMFFYNLSSFTTQFCVLCFCCCCQCLFSWNFCTL